MKNGHLLYSTRELNEIIHNCRSLNEIQSLILNLESEFETYSISDQGFLLAMIGMAIMKISDNSQQSNRYESKMKLLLLSRVNLRERKSREAI